MRSVTPRINTLSREDFKALTLSNLADNPATLILLASVFGLYCLAANFVAVRVKRSQRHLLNKKELQQLRENWIQKARLDNEIRSFQSFRRQLKLELYKEHLWISSFKTSWGSTFGPQARLALLLLCLLMELATSALFYGTQTPTGSVGVASISFVAVMVPTEFFRFLFMRAGPPGPRDQFQLDVAALKAEAAGREAPRPGCRLPTWSYYIVMALLYLLCAALAFVVLLYGLQFDLQHDTSVVWSPPYENTFRDGLEVSVSYNNTEDCQEACRLDPSCNGISIRRRDCQCYLVVGGGVADELFVSYEATPTYQRTENFITAFLYSVAFDILVGKPFPVLLTVLLTFYLMHRVGTHLSYEKLRIKVADVYKAQFIHESDRADFGTGDDDGLELAAMRGQGSKAGNGHGDGGGGDDDDDDDGPPGLIPLEMEEDEDPYVSGDGDDGGDGGAVVVGAVAGPAGQGEAVDASTATEASGDKGGDRGGGGGGGQKEPEAAAAAAAAAATSAAASSTSTEAAAAADQEAAGGSSGADVDVETTT